MTLPEAYKCDKCEFHSKTSKFDPLFLGRNLFRYRCPVCQRVRFIRYYVLRRPAPVS